ncbi:MAG: hypothetical protein K1V76_05065 [Candidatus Amulumruptor sp.]
MTLLTLRKISRAFIAAVAVSLMCIGVSSCSKTDDDRIPVTNVHLSISQAAWIRYGIHGAFEHVYFIKQRGIPTGYPYVAFDETGYAGILLVTGGGGESDLKAYSPACPVERDNQVIIEITTDDEQHPIARCPRCQSTFDVFNYGTPLTGEAAQRKFSLSPYSIHSEPGYPVIVTP